MATYQKRLEDAIVAAHEAGDTEAATILAQELKSWQPKRSAPPESEPGFGAQLNATIAGLPRKAGLTLRHLVEGMADNVGIFSDPLAYASNKIFDTHLTTARGAMGGLLDAAGVPSPETPTERVVGDASRMLAGYGAVINGSKAVGGGVKALMTDPVRQAAVDKTVAAVNVAPAHQAVGAVGSGLSGGYTRESGGDAGSQFVAALAGGLVAPLSMEGVNRITQGAKSAFNSVRNLGNAPAPNVNVDVVIESALKPTGLKLSDLANNIKSQLRNDVASALKIGNNLTPAALNRLVQYRLTGATPAGANLTLDPVQVTQLQNLSRIGANSDDPALQALAQRANQNARILVNNLNELGADAADDAFGAGQKIIDELNARNSRVKGVIDTLYKNARDTEGRSAMLDPSSFTNKAADLLHRENVESFLPPDIRNKINAFATGEAPLTVEIAEQLKTSIGKLQRNSTDGNVRTALSLVRQALDDTNLSPQYHGRNPNNLPMPFGTVPKSGMELGEESLKAFNTARNVNRKWMNIVDRTPALKAVRDGIEPDKFVQQFIISNGSTASVMDVAALKSSLRSSPAAMQVVREQIAAYLKKQAIGTGTDDAMNFSQAGYRKALDAIGERKLNLFFNKEQVAQLKAIGDVAFAEQFQPAGSAVNNSNSGALALAGMLDRIASASILRKIPFGAEIVGNPIRNVANSLNANNALNVPRGLVSPQPRLPLLPTLFPTPMQLLTLPGGDQRNNGKGN